MGRRGRFRRDDAGARDGYVYHYFIRLQGNPSSLNVHVPGMIHLARVPKNEMMTKGAYEFFAGADGDGKPTWTTDPAARQPVFEDPNGVGWNLSVSFNAGLGRYILCTEHTATFEGRLGMFDASTPWGPWTTVVYTDSFGAGWIDTTTFFWNFSNKWLSADGEDFVLVFSGVGSNDSWNTVEGAFTVAVAASASSCWHLLGVALPLAAVGAILILRRRTPARAEQTVASSR